MTLTALADAPIGLRPAFPHRREVGYASLMRFQMHCCCRMSGPAEA